MFAILFFSQDYSDDEQSITDLDAATASDGEESSVVSGMSEYLNGNLGMMENTVQQLSNQARVEDAIEDTALDIRPEITEQAQNQLVSRISFVSNFVLDLLRSVLVIISTTHLLAHFLPLVCKRWK